MALKTLSTADLKKELTRRKKDAGNLLARRDKLVKQIAEIEEALSFLTGAAQARRRAAGARTRRRRARNDISLPDAIAKALPVHAVVSPKEAAELVQKNGFKTTSRSFNMMVSNALAKDKRFKRIERGQYERVA